MSDNGKPPGRDTHGRFQTGAKPGPGRPAKTIGKPPAVDVAALIELATPFKTADAAILFLESTSCINIDYFYQRCPPEVRARIDRIRHLESLATRVLIQRLERELPAK